MTGSFYDQTLELFKHIILLSQIEHHFPLNRFLLNCNVVKTNCKVLVDVSVSPEEELENQLGINQPKTCLFDGYSNGNRCKYFALFGDIYAMKNHKNTNKVS
jgi:hypothetical protein